MVKILKLGTGANLICKGKLKKDTAENANDKRAGYILGTTVHGNYYTHSCFQYRYLV
jgi:hypothetical protein